MDQFESFSMAGFILEQTSQIDAIYAAALGMNGKGAQTEMSNIRARIAAIRRGESGEKAAVEAYFDSKYGLAQAPVTDRDLEEFGIGLGPPPPVP